MDFLEKIPLPAKATFNQGLSSVGNAAMRALFGEPVADGAYRADGDCTQVDNPALLKLLETRSVGPFRVTGIKPALDALQPIFARVETEVPDLYAILGSAGMLCARFTKIRQHDGSLKIGPGVSNHSWGSAVDVELSKKLDKQGDGFTQRGLLVLSAYFNAARWYWGAGFPTEDSMHFEASAELLADWRKSGLI